MALDTYDSCNCHANSTLGWDTPEDVANNLTTYEIHDLLQDWYEVAYNAGPFGNLYIEMYTSDDDEMKYKPKPGYNKSSESYMTTSKLEKFELMLFQTLIFGGNQGVMASGSSANDPLFWVFHQLFDKAVQALRLAEVQPECQHDMEQRRDGGG